MRCSNHPSPLIPAHRWSHKADTAGSGMACCRVGRTVRDGKEARPRRRMGENYHVCEDGIAPETTVVSRCLAIGAVALHSVPGRPGTSEPRSLNNQVRIALVDVQSDVACPLWCTAFVALFPCSEKLGFVGEQIPIAARSSVGSKPRNNRRGIFAGIDSQNSSRSANWISRGVPEPTGVIGFTMAVFKFTVLVMAPNPAEQPVGFEDERSHVTCGWPNCG
jgi:hypothetical protein